MTALSDIAPVVRRIVPIILLVNAGLLLLGVALYPTVLGADGLQGIVAALVILAVYGFLALGSPVAAGRADPALLRLGLCLGLIGGGLLCLDLISSYFTLHDIVAGVPNSLFAYGAFLLLVLLGGGWGAARTGRFGAGITVALWAVLSGLLLWFCVEFASFYLFASTTAGAAFIRDEMAADFARSGATDYPAFVMSDFYGAGFYHLLLGLLCAGILGTLGAVGGLLLRVGQAHRIRPPPGKQWGRRGAYAIMVSDAKEAPMSMTYGEALAWLDQFVNFERRAGPAYTADVYRLDRFRHLLAELGDPQDRTPAVIVAGTKGKGSTAALIEAGARAAGCRTGFYSSPHLHTFRERIHVAGALITEEALAALVETRLRPVVAALMATGDPALEPTYFELITALGFLTFAEQEVELAVLEVGLGGRLDPTNVVTPLLSVITPISYDHMAVLGDTLAQIAFEKAGIIKPGGVALSAPQPAEAAGVIAQVATERGATLYHPADLLPLDPASLAVQRDATGLPLGRTLALLPLGADGVPAGAPFHLPLPLLGRHQVGNAQVAAAALLLLRRNGPDALRQGSLADLGRALAQGFATVDWPGRLEIVDRAPLTVLDGAHNGESAQRLREALEEDFGVTGRQVVIVMGVNRGHSVADIVRELAPIAAHVVLTPLHSPRSTPPAELATVWAPYAVPVSLTTDVPSALQAAAQLAATGDARLICVTGSLYLVGEAREAFGRSYGHDPT